MKKNLVYLVVAVALFTSCSSAYRTSQTPDDVYYSPAKRVIAADQYETYNSSSDRYNSTSPDDEYLRMKVQDHERWSTIDDYNYWYDSRYYANNYYSPYSSYSSLGIGLFGSYPYYGSYNTWYNPWSSWYNPCYTVVYYKNPTVYYQPVNRYSLAGYNNRNYNNNNMPLQNSNRGNAYTNSNANTNRARNNNTYYQPQNNDSRPSRTFNNSSSNSNVNSGGGGGGSRTSGGGTRTRP